MRTASVAILLLIIAVAGCSDRAQPKVLDQSIRPAKIITVQSANRSRSYQFAAQVEALRTVDLSFQVSGPLASINVREGETVPGGNVIAALETRDFVLALREAEVQLKLATRDLRRKQQVLLDNGIAQSQVDDAQSNYDLRVISLQQARERLDDATLKAPFDAYIARRYVDAFVNIQAGTPVARVHDLNQLLIVCSIPQELLATVNAEQVVSSTATFTFAPGQPFDIVFHENRGEADSLAQTFSVSFLMDKPGAFNVLPGMNATVSVEISQSDESGIIVPASSLTADASDQLTVWVFDPDTQLVSRRVVQTGAPQNDGVPIIAGLRDGEQIVVAGASQLQAGMKVRPLR